MELWNAGFALCTLFRHQENRCSVEQQDKTLIVMSKTKKNSGIGVPYNRGDCPGLNAAIRAVTRTSIYYGHEVIGFLRGYEGLIENQYLMNSHSVSNILQPKGGDHFKNCTQRTIQNC